MSNTNEKFSIFNSLKNELTLFQKKLHYPSKDYSEEEEYDEEDKLASIFSRQFKKSPWYYQFPEVMDASQVSRNGTDYHVFKVNMTPHALLYSDITQELPHIQCQNGYTARWTHNVGSNIIIEGSLMLDGRKIQSIDYRYNDNFNQTMLSPSKRSNIDRNLGNCISGENFLPKLKRFTTSYTPNWFYNIEVSNYFPLFYCGLFNKLEHHLLLRRKISDLLEIRDPDGKPVKLSTKSIKSIDGSTSFSDDHMLPLPKMFGKYLLFSDEECTHNTNLCFDKSDAITNRNIYFIEDIVIVEQKNPSSLGSTQSLELKDIKFPCNRLCWVAQNQQAYKNKSYSNYTTNSEYISEGYSPFRDTSLYKGTEEIFSEMPSYRTERFYPEKHYPCVPYQNGYNSWSFGYDAGDVLIAQPGVVFNNGIMNFNLQDSDPVLDDTDHECHDQFKIVVFATVVKKLTFETFPKNEAERQTVGVKINIE
uniref:Major capsid protein N-terminal domain-containing protein n=1 Tax=viral metagenome TaxID=1070528 RepID=A0A6C0AF23_9ZZZZ